MKNLMLILAGMLLFVTPAFSELSNSDLQRIREIVQIEVSGTEQRLRSEITASEQRLRSEITASEQRLRAEMTAAITASEKRMKEHGDINMDGLDKRVNLLAALLIGIFALIVVAIGLPQLIVAYKQRGQEELRTEFTALRTELKALHAEIEHLKQRDKAHPESL